MPHEGLKRPSKGAVLRTSLSDQERGLIQIYADQEGLCLEEAADRLASDGLARRVRKRTGHRPASYVSGSRRNRG